MATFLQLTGVQDKASALMRSSTASADVERYAVATERFDALPTKPIAYWVSDRVLHLFAEESEGQSLPRVAKNGLGTLGDFRFVRLIFETETCDQSSFPDYCKGGKRSPYFQEVLTTVNWAQDGLEVKAHIVHKYGGGHWSRNARSVNFYGRPGITWPLRGARFSAQAMQRQGVFSVGGKMMFADSDGDLLVLLWFMNSRAFNDLLMLFAGKVSGAQYQPGLIEMLPMPAIADDIRSEVERLTRRIWNVYRSISAESETSRFFVAPSVLLVQGATLDERITSAISRRSHYLKEVSEISRRLDELAEVAFGLDEKFRRDAERLFPADVSAEPTKTSREDSASAALSREEAVEALLSWLVGAALGRFSIEFDQNDAIEEIDPFAAMSRPAAGLVDSRSIVDAGRSLVMATVDKGSPLDLEPAMELSLVGVVGEQAAGDLWSGLQRAVEARFGSVSGWLTSRYFDRHISEYSAAQRRAPVVWPIGTRSRDFTVWLYAHRVTGDSLYRVLHDVVSPKLGLERRRLSEVAQEAGPNPSASERKAIAGQEALVGELKELADELTAVAPLLHPDLSDGIVVVLAPMWRLFAHHKPWSNELRTHWDNLVAGEYDWAQLAMHLWPERVVPKCADDRSLAIAHGLQEVFWVRDDRNPDKWHPRETPTVIVEQLIADRTNPATKAALEDAAR